MVIRFGAQPLKRSLNFRGRFSYFDNKTLTFHTRFPAKIAPSKQKIRKEKRYGYLGGIRGGRCRGSDREADISGSVLKSALRYRQGRGQQLSSSCQWIEYEKERTEAGPLLFVAFQKMNTHLMFRSAFAHHARFMIHAQPNSILKKEAASFMEHMTRMSAKPSGSTCVFPRNSSVKFFHAGCGGSCCRTGHAPVFLSGLRPRCKMETGEGCAGNHKALHRAAEVSHQLNLLNCK